MGAPGGRRWVAGWAGESVDGWTSGRIGGGIEGQPGQFMDRLVGGWMDGWVSEFLGRSFVEVGDLEANDGFVGVPLLNVEVFFGLKVPGLEVPPLLGKLFDFFSITTEFFP